MIKTLFHSVSLRLPEWELNPIWLFFIASLGLHSIYKLVLQIKLCRNGVWMELFKEKGDCCGCSACMNVCGKHAIHMRSDEEGFLYPEIEESLCVSCEKCKEVCAFQNGYRTKDHFVPSLGFAVKHKEEEIREQSRSGGMFTALTDYILEKGGAVYGAGFGEHFSVQHKRAVTKEERDEFRGSKYVQSNMGDCFPKVRQDLEEGRKVLFSGTACQVAGLKRYLGKWYHNLFTVDIVCHGTPSPKIWEDFLRMREKELGSPVTAVNFRDKEKYGWAAHYESVVAGGKKYYSRIYTKLFYQNAVLRPACYECRYTNKRRPGDITLADFWGHEKAVPGFHEDDRGVSLVLVNSKRGKQLFDVVKKKLYCLETTGYPYRHTNMKRPSDCPEFREQFWEEYKTYGFAYISEHYAGHTPVPFWKARLKRLLKRFPLFRLYRKLKKKRKLPQPTQDSHLEFNRETDPATLPESNENKSEN